MFCLTKKFLRKKLGISEKPLSLWIQMLSKELIFRKKSFVNSCKSSILQGGEVENVSMAKNWDLPRYWGTFGAILFIIYFFIYICFWIQSAYSDNETLENCIRVLDYSIDIYFIFDFILVLTTDYIKSEANMNILGILRLRFYKSWFLIDLFVFVPYGTLWNIWKSRPVVRLINMRNSRRPILKFMFSRNFRRSALSLVKEYYVEKKLLEMWLGFPKINRSFVEKVKFRSATIFRVLRKMRMLETFTDVLYLLFKLTFSLRAWTVMSVAYGGRAP